MTGLLKIQNRQKSINKNNKYRLRNAMTLANEKNTSVPGKKNEYLFRIKNTICAAPWNDDE